MRSENNPKIKEIDFPFEIRKAKSAMDEKRVQQLYRMIEMGELYEVDF